MEVERGLQNCRFADTRSCFFSVEDTFELSGFDRKPLLVAVTLWGLKLTLWA